MREFAGFKPREHKYIKLGLEIAKDSNKSEGLFVKWSRNLSETEAIISRQEAYRAVARIKGLNPENFDTRDIRTLLGPLIELSNYDLKQGYLDGFSAYRFLYERLFGSTLRPWLPAAFCAAAAMPNLDPKRRKWLLQSISEAAATAPGWSTREPEFFPEWVEKEK